MMRWLSAIALASTALAFVPIPSLATTVPPVITAANVNVAENAGTASIVLTKPKAGSYSKVTLQTVDGTAKAGVDYTAVNLTVTLGNSATRYVVNVPILNNATYQGTRVFTVKLTCMRFCTAQAPVTATITDDEPAPTPAPQWVSAPLTSGGYARCKAICHGFAAPYPAIIAQQGDVWLYAWNGVSSGTSGMEQRQIGAFWPIGQYKVAGVGVEGFSDEWEGAAPAAGSIVGSLVTRQGLIYRVVSSEPDQFATGTIYGVQYISDTTGRYYLANDPVLKDETQYFMASDLTP